MHHADIENHPNTYLSDSPRRTAEIAAALARQLGPGTVVLLHGPLGAGKTTFVRGILASFGHTASVRSPTFNLIQTFETEPPVMHADLYRVSNFAGIGLEDYLVTHVCLIEWADRATGLIDPCECWCVTISFAGEGREIAVRPPDDASPVKSQSCLSRS
jgi:tRNA threonylcarbamoyladenosine biosynthesis protein TsaE